MKRLYLTFALAVVTLGICAQPTTRLQQLPGIQQSVVSDKASAALPRNHMQKVAPRRAAILSEQPAGILHDGLTRSSVSMVTNLGQTRDNVAYEGKVCKWVEGDDGFVYLYDPIVAYHSDAWMKGTWGGRGEQGDTLWFTGPQLMREDDYTYLVYSYYAQRLEYRNEAWSVNKNNQKTMFVWRDGKLIQPAIKNVGFGFVNKDGEPYSLMDHHSEAVPMTDTPLVLS
nr:hypothetical protein [Prevotella sp.]